MLSTQIPHFRKRLGYHRTSTKVETALFQKVQKHFHPSGMGEEDLSIFQVQYYKMHHKDVEEWGNDNGISFDVSKTNACG